MEHLTGSLAEAIRYFARLDAAVQLRFTTKFDAVEPLLSLDHNRRTRMRVSVNAPSLVRFEGGIVGLLARLQAARRRRRRATALASRSHLSCRWRVSWKSIGRCSTLAPRPLAKGPGQTSPSS
jgi:hypothetical protein